MCGYLPRPPVALERLSVDGDGLVVYELKRPFTDGTTHVLFEPLDFIARLAALVPRPRVHLLRYHGLFAPNARQRHRVVPEPSQPPAPDDAPQPAPPRPATSRSWMQRLHRAFGLDLSRCPRCGAPLRVLAHITDPKVIARIIEHLATPDAGVHLARAPP